MKKRTVFIGIAIICMLALSYSLLTSNDDGSSKANKKAPASAFNLHKYSTNDPTSIWVVVNKRRPLNPKNYAPSNLVTPAVQLRNSGSSNMQLQATAAHALERLSTAAQSSGVRLKLFSGYRSYDQQVSTYNSEVQAFGQAQADRESARPGYSEHQTGFAVDISAANGKCELQACFGDTNEGKWLAQHAHVYGFIVSYPKNKEQVTGYTYEPWHIRYVGTELSQEMYKRHIQTLNEIFNIPASTTY